MITFEGHYTFDAPRDLIWSLLHDPDVARVALPGCERYASQSAADALVTLTLPVGPLHGSYDGRVTVVDAQAPLSFTLALTGSGEGKSFAGDGRFTLSEKDGQTRLQYDGEVEVTDPLKQVSERLLQTTANSLVRQYLESIAAQARAHLGLPLESRGDARPAGAGTRASSTIDMQDWLAEMRRDRRITLILIFVAVFGSLSVIGMLIAAVWIGRWSTRRYARHLARLVQEERDSQAAARPAPDAQA